MDAEEQRRFDYGQAQQCVQELAPLVNLMHKTFPDIDSIRRIKEEVYAELVTLNEIVRSFDEQPGD